MASSYFKLKILRRKRNSLVANNVNIQIPNSLDMNNIERNKCRICLLEGSISIFDDCSKEIRESIRLFGGIDVSEDDNFPEYLCSSCYALLQNAILFRKKAQETNILLKKQTFHAQYSTSAIALESVNNCIELDKPIKSNNENLIPVVKKHKCDTCNLSFSTQNELDSHKNSKQHKNVRIQCPICKGLFKSQLYKKHLARHQSASHFVCEVCGKMYRKDNLIRHLQLHSFELPFQCKVCPYRGRFLESLKIHMRTHSGQKPFSCDKCHLHFLTKSNLNRHLLTHNKNKPFKCEECNRGFYLKRDMILHFTSDHSGIKNFGCKQCGNKYGSRKSLMRHELRVHKRAKMAKGRIPLYLQAEYKK